MRVLVPVLLMITLLFSACSPEGLQFTADGLPILYVDEAHLQFSGSAGKMYAIPAGKGFALDLSNYTFEIPAGLGFDQVNMIRISLGPGEEYAADVRRTVTRYSLTADTLTPVEGSPPFTGLESGDLVSIGIGYWDDVRGFYVLWFGAAEVE